MAFDCFLKLGKIDGTATEKDHAKWIDLSSFQWGVANQRSAGMGSGGFSGAGAATTSDVVVTKVVDRSSPELMKHSVEGKHIDKAEFHFVGGPQKNLKFMTIVLNDVLVSSVNFSASSGDSPPLESVTLNFTKVQVTVTPIDPRKGTLESGNIQMGFDFSTHKPA
ncbi:MAG: type VI secretion system tube protein Hcp [Planctomycetes bacterium]|nr:type VI secretion system tube protein Hcp [Planctomycetota bacterium]